MSRPAVLGAAACLVLFAVAPAAATASAPAWIVDKPHSALRFSASMNGEAFSGVFGRWNADIRFNPKALSTSSVAVGIDMASAQTGNADRDQALPTGDFFAAARYPRATFAAHRFKSLGSRRYLAFGVLTVRGISKPLTLPFGLAITGRLAKMSAVVAVNRLAFDIGQDQWKATDVIPAAVTVTIAITATRAR